MTVHAQHVVRCAWTNGGGAVSVSVRQREPREAPRWFCEPLRWPCDDPPRRGWPEPEGAPVRCWDGPPGRPDCCPRADDGLRVLDLVGAGGAS